MCQSLRRGPLTEEDFSKITEAGKRCLRGKPQSGVRAGPTKKNNKKKKQGKKKRHVACRRLPLCLKTTARWSSVLELTYIRTAGALDVLKLKATSSLVRLTSCGVRRWCTVMRASRLAPATASGRKLYLTSVPASKKPPTSEKTVRRLSTRFARRESRTHSCGGNAPRTPRVHGESESMCCEHIMGWLSVELIGILENRNALKQRKRCTTKF